MWRIFRMFCDLCHFLRFPLNNIKKILSKKKMQVENTYGMHFKKQQLKTIFRRVENDIGDIFMQHSQTS